jgi:heme/copper-type cytochrome/quinol oxidase subunit 2
VYSVIVPAIVIDRAGFRAMGRSAALTKNYRWPIIGALILMILCIFLVVFVIAFSAMAAIGLSGGVDTPSVLGPWLLAEAAFSAIAYGWLSITIALIFARLKEIKEGVSVSDLVDVFK